MFRKSLPFHRMEKALENLIEFKPNFPEEKYDSRFFIKEEHLDALKNFFKSEDGYGLPAKKFYLNGVYIYDKHTGIDTEAAWASGILLRYEFYTLLSIAAEAGNEEASFSLLRWGSNLSLLVSHDGFESTNSLGIAIINGHFKLAERMIDFYLTQETRDLFSLLNQNILHNIIDSKKTNTKDCLLIAEKIVQLMVDNKINLLSRCDRKVDEPEENKLTPESVGEGETILVRALENGIDFFSKWLLGVLKKNAFLESALNMHALYLFCKHSCKHDEPLDPYIENIVRKKINVRFQYYSRGQYTLIGLAAEDDDFKLCQLFLSYGAKITKSIIQSGREVVTPIGLAVCSASLITIQGLVREVELRELNMQIALGPNIMHNLFVNRRDLSNDEAVENLIMGVMRKANVNCFDLMGKSVLYNGENEYRDTIISKLILVHGGFLKAKKLIELALNKKQYNYLTPMLGSSLCYLHDKYPVFTENVLLVMMEKRLHLKAVLNAEILLKISTPLLREIINFDASIVNIEHSAVMMKAIYLISSKKKFFEEIKPKIELIIKSGVFSVKIKLLETSRTFWEETLYQIKKFNKTLTPSYVEIVLELKKFYFHCQYYSGMIPESTFLSNLGFALLDRKKSMARIARTHYMMWEPVNSVNSSTSSSNIAFEKDEYKTDCRIM